MHDRLRAIAEHLERSAREAKARGEAESALAFYEAAVMVRAVMDPARALVLKRGEYSPKIAAMDADHREAISKGRSKNNALMKAARKAGYRSAIDLRAALKSAGYEASAAFLSMVGTGAKPMPAALLTALKKLRIDFEP